MPRQVLFAPSPFDKKEARRNTVGLKYFILSKARRHSRAEVSLSHAQAHPRGEKQYYLIFIQTYFHHKDVRDVSQIIL